MSLSSMAVRRSALLAFAALALASTACRVQVDKNGDDGHKDVKIDTPLGGVHVNENKTSAADVGLPPYPGSHQIEDSNKDNSADVRLGFGSWQLRVKVVKYETGDPQDKVLAFYRKALGRFGDVIECHNDQPVGKASTREGLTCDEHDPHGTVQVQEDHHDISLKAGSPRHQHILGIENNDSSGTRYALIELDLPGSGHGNSDESN